MGKIKKILIVEDELLIAKVLRMQLENLGFEVENVVDGHQALLRTQEMIPDLIILDNYLKNDTIGTQVGIKLREMGKNIPIIFVTGNSFDQMVKETSSIENSFVLSKPVVFDQLIQIISNFSNNDK